MGLRWTRRPIPIDPHPPPPLIQLVIINVSDDVTRARVLHPDAPPPVAGVLLGRHAPGGAVEIANSFSVTVAPDGATVDGALLAKRLDQCAC